MPNDARIGMVLVFMGLSLPVQWQGKGAPGTDWPPPHHAPAAPHMHAYCLEILEPYLKPGNKVCRWAPGTGMERGFTD